MCGPVRRRARSVASGQRRATVRGWFAHSGSRGRRVVPGRTGSESNGGFGCVGARLPIEHAGEPWFCYFGCPNCQPDFGEGQEGKRRYREWRAMEDELLAELAERSQSRTPGGPRPRVTERRVGDGASGSGVATGISPNPASRRPLGQAALARRSAPIRPSSGERALDGYVLLVVRAIAPFASGDDLVDVSSAQSRIAPSGSRSVTPSRRQLVFVGAGSRRRRCGRRGRKRLSARSVCMMTFGLIPISSRISVKRRGPSSSRLAAVGVSQAVLSLHSHGRRSNRALA